MASEAFKVIVETPETSHEGAGVVYKDARMMEAGYSMVMAMD